MVSKEKILSVTLRSAMWEGAVHAPACPKLVGRLEEARILAHRNFPHRSVFNQLTLLLRKEIFCRWLREKQDERENS